MSRVLDYPVGSRGTVRVPSRAYAHGMHVAISSCKLCVLPRGTVRTCTVCLHVTPLSSPPDLCKVLNSYIGSPRKMMTWYPPGCWRLHRLLYHHIQFDDVLVDFLPRQSVQDMPRFSPCLGRCILEIYPIPVLFLLVGS